MTASGAGEATPRAAAGIAADQSSRRRPPRDARQPSEQRGSAEFRYLHGGDEPWDAAGRAESSHRQCYVDTSAHQDIRRSALTARSLPKEERERRWRRWLGQAAAERAAEEGPAYAAAAATTAAVAACRAVSDEDREQQWRAWLVERRRRQQPSNKGRAASWGPRPGLEVPPLALAAAVDAAATAAAARAQARAVQSARAQRRCEQLWLRRPTGRPLPSDVGEGPFASASEAAAAASVLGAGAASMLPAGAILGGASSVATMGPPPAPMRPVDKPICRKVVVPPKEAYRPGLCNPGRCAAVPAPMVVEAM